MGRIDEETLSQLRSLIPDEAIVAAVAEADITEEESQALESQMILLAGQRDRELWTHASLWIRLEGKVLLEHAAAAVQQLAAAETEAGGHIMRDSITMMLELVHLSGDPGVLAQNPDNWLWGPLGPPIQGFWEDLPAEQRYPEHARRLGRKWNTAINDAFDNHDLAVCDAAIEAAGESVERGFDALVAGYDALNSTTDAIDAGFEISMTKPRRRWPRQDMARYSDIGWKAAAVLRSSTEALLEGAAGAGVLAALEAHDSYEERGILVAAARARSEALRRWFDLQGPSRPPSDDGDPTSISFWTTDPEPLGFWAAAMIAARIEVGRAFTNGEPSGAVESLLNR